MDGWKLVGSQPLPVGSSFHHQDLLNWSSAMFSWKQDTWKTWYYFKISSQRTWSIYIYVMHCHCI